MHRIPHSFLSKSLAVMVVATHGGLMSGPAMAHWGHLGDLAGHSHIAGVVFGGVAAALAAGLAATRKKGKPATMPERDPVQDSEDPNTAADNGCAPDGQQGEQAHA